MLIDLSGVSLAMGDRQLFSNIYMTLEGPGTVALMGPSGSGKTTLLAMLAGEIRPNQGSISISGTLDDQPSVGWMIQSSPLLTRRTAAENVALGAIARGATRTDAHDTALQLLDSLRIDALAKVDVKKLSGGERQRVSVARTLAQGFPIVLADEPTASLDAESRASVCDALEIASRAGSLVVIATHDRYVAERCGRVLELKNGTLVDA